MKSYKWLLLAATALLCACGSVYDDPLNPENDRDGASARIDKGSQAGETDEGDPSSGTGSEAATPADGNGDYVPPTPTGTGQKRVFVTSVAYTGDLAGEGGATTGLAGADALCAWHATDAALGGSWVAWLSTSATQAIDRLPEGTWTLVDGTTQVFGSKLDIRRNPAVAIARDERGQSIDSRFYVWTGTNERGQLSDHSCADWTTDSGRAGQHGDVGNMRERGQGWSENGSLYCSELARIYCFEI